MAPQSIAIFPPVFPVWNTFMGWVNVGGLNNGVEQVVSPKGSGSGGAPKRAAGKPVCRYVNTEEGCPYGDAYQFPHEAPGAKGKADGPSASRNTKRQARGGGNSGGGNSGGAVGASASSSNTSKSKRKGEASAGAAADHEEDE